MLRGFMLCVILLLVTSSVLANPRRKGTNRTLTNTRAKARNATSLLPSVSGSVGKNLTTTGAGKSSGLTTAVIDGAAVTITPVIKAVSNASANARKRTTKKSKTATKATTKALPSTSSLPPTTPAVEDLVDPDEDDSPHTDGDDGLSVSEETSIKSGGAASQAQGTVEPNLDVSDEKANEEAEDEDLINDSPKKNVVSTTAVYSKNVPANATTLPVKAATTAKALIFQTTSSSKPNAAPAGAEESDEPNQKQIKPEQDEGEGEGGSMEHSLEAQQEKPAHGSETDSGEVEDLAPVTTHNSDESLEAAGPVPGVDQDEQDVSASKHDEEGDGDEDVSANKPPSKFETDNEKYPSGYEAHDDDEDSWLPGSSSFMTYFLIGSSVIFVTYFVYHYRSRIAGRCFACFLEGRRGGRSTGARQRQRSANGRNNSGSGGESATVEYKPLRSTEKD